jgi:hypothetical protein
MTPTETRDSNELGAEALARVARRLEEPVDETRDKAARERFLLALSTRSSRSALRRLLLVAAALGLAAVAAVILVRRQAAQLDYRIAGPLVTDGVWLGVAPAEGPLSLNFSDGTQIELGGGSKGQVTEVTAHGARVVLGTGVLEARVVHRPHARWAVTAGPYSIEVTGTAFDVVWSASDEELVLSLHDGSVIVHGPSLDDGLRVAAGQRLVARSTTGVAQLSSLVPAMPARPETVSPVPNPILSAAPEPGHVHAASRPAATWPEMLADGNFRGVLSAADARGIDASLTRASLSDLVALSDAARYLHERSLAKRGLLAERSRFVGSDEARGAAFLLGRMADDVGARDEAIRWYDTYLTESPAGPFVAEALGRKLVALVESGDAADAHSVAREYLKRFPHGAHAAYAHDHVPEP